MTRNDGEAGDAEAGDAEAGDAEIAPTGYLVPGRRGDLRIARQEPPIVNDK